MEMANLCFRGSLMVYRCLVGFPHTVQNDLRDTERVHCRQLGRVVGTGQLENEVGPCMWNWRSRVAMGDERDQKTTRRLPLQDQVA